MSVFIGTWADIRPTRIIFSPVSGWNAESYKYFASHNSSNVLHPSITRFPALYSRIIRWAVSRSLPVVSKFSGLVSRKKCLARFRYVPWSNFGLDKSTPSGKLILYDCLLFDAKVTSYLKNKYCLLLVILLEIVYIHFLVAAFIKEVCLFHTNCLWINVTKNKKNNCRKLQYPPLVSFLLTPATQPNKFTQLNIYEIFDRSKFSLLRQNANLF